MIIDAKGAVVGRLATVVAKKALLGETVDIINAESAVIAGDKRKIISDYKQKYARGVPRKGPYIHRMPDRFLRRRIRGMLPYKTSRGREAFERIMCHVGCPEVFEGKETVTVEAAVKMVKGITVKQLCKELGGSL